MDDGNLRSRAAWPLRLDRRIRGATCSPSLTLVRPGGAGALAHYVYIDLKAAGKAVVNNIRDWRLDPEEDLRLWPIVAATTDLPASGNDLNL